MPFVQSANAANAEQAVIMKATRNTARPAHGDAETRTRTLGTVGAAGTVESASETAVSQTFTNGKNAQRTAGYSPALSAQQTKLMSELAHDPKNLKLFLNRYGDEAASLIKRHGYPPKYWKGRPSYKEGQVETVWENKAHGKDYFINENSELITWNKDIPRNGQWDMGHIVEDINKPNIYAREYDKYLSGEITEDTFLEWYRNAKNYEPQLPRYNRGLKEKK